ncbi:hypothetical protein PI124_g5920 [Phytophthora idaei]|nr:hypothetical protein PI124_g5920 [Phytophthora idaei]
MALGCHPGPSDRFSLPKKPWLQEAQDIAPILRWLPHYDVQRDLKFDILAGITVTMMLIPQEVSLSTIMNVPAHHGPAGLRHLRLQHGADERVATGSMMAFLSGCILILVRLLNLSQLADFFSCPVMGGFISAGGLLIMLSQFSNALGIKFASQDYPPQTVYQIFNHIGSTNLTAFAVVAISIVYLFAVKLIKKHYFPSPVPMQLFESPLKEEEKARQETERVLTPVQTYGAPAHTIHSHGFSLSEDQYQSMENAYSAAGRVSDVGDKCLQEPKPTSKAMLVAIFLARAMCDLGPLVVCIFGGIVGYLLGSSHLKLTGTIPGGFPDPKVPWYGFTEHLIDGDKFGNILYHSLTVVVVVFLSSIAMAKRLAIQRGEDINTDQELTGLGIASIVAGFFQAMPPNRRNVPNGIEPAERPHPTGLDLYLDNGSFVDRELFPEARDLHDIIGVRADSSLSFANCERIALAIEHEMIRLKSLGITTSGVLVDARHMNDMDATTIQVMSDTQEKLRVRKVRFGICNAKSRVDDLLSATNIIKRIVAGDPSIPLEDAVQLLREQPIADKTSRAFITVRVYQARTRHQISVSIVNRVVTYNRY